MNKKLFLKKNIAKYVVKLSCNAAKEFRKKFEIYKKTEAILMISLKSQIIVNLTKADLKSVSM